MAIKRTACHFTAMFFFYPAKDRSDVTGNLTSRYTLKHDYTSSEAAHYIASPSLGCRLVLHNVPEVLCNWSNFSPNERRAQCR